MRARHMLPLVLLGALLPTTLGSSCGGSGGSDEGGGGPRDPGYPASIHEIYLPDTDQDECFLSFTTKEGMFFWINGVRDARGVPQRITELVLTEGPDERARVSFDDRQRPLRLNLPNGVEFQFEYAGGDVVLTVLTGMDEMESAAVQSIYFPKLDADGPKDDSAEAQVCEAIYGTPDIQLWAGEVVVCDDDTPPIVLIAAEDIETKEIKQTRAKLRRSGVDPRVYSYYYHVNLTPDFDEWQRFCACTKVATAAVVVGSVFSGGVSLASSIRGLVNVVQQALTDFSAERIDDACRVVVDDLFSGVDAIIEEVGAYLEEGGYMCSRQRFENLQRMHKQEIRIFAVDRQLREHQDFTPIDENQIMPRFDFTPRCCQLAAVDWVRHTPADPHYTQTVTVTARFVPPAENCEITFWVRFQGGPPDYSLTGRTNANGEASIQVPGNASLRGVRTAVQVEDGVPTEYEGSPPGVNSVNWDWGF